MAASANNDNSNIPIRGKGFFLRAFQTTSVVLADADC